MRPTTLSDQGGHRHSLRSSFNSLGIFILRLGTGLMLAGHALPKLEMLTDGRAETWLDPLGWGSALSLLLCCAAELLGALCFVLGLLTRVAAIVLAFNFAVVISVVLPKPDLNLQELAFFYLLACITLLCTGAGRFSLDRFVIPRLMGLLRKD